MSDSIDSEWLTATINSHLDGLHLEDDGVFLNTHEDRTELDTVVVQVDNDGEITSFKVRIEQI